MFNSTILRNRNTFSELIRNPIRGSIYLVRISAVKIFVELSGTKWRNMTEESPSCFFQQVTHDESPSCIFQQVTHDESSSCIFQHGTQNESPSCIFQQRTHDERHIMNVYLVFSSKGHMLKVCPVFSKKKTYNKSPSCIFQQNAYYECQSCIFQQEEKRKDGPLISCKGHIKKVSLLFSSMGISWILTQGIYRQQQAKHAICQKAHTGKVYKDQILPKCA